MRKTSLYLGPQDFDRLRRLALRHHTTYAALIRQALAVLEASDPPNRQFALTGSFSGEGGSIADVDEDVLLRGFGG
jgi:hypothetical protein